jgi:hypothetical protein
MGCDQSTYNRENNEFSEFNNRIFRPLARVIDPEFNTYIANRERRERERIERERIERERIERERKKRDTKYTIKTFTLFNIDIDRQDTCTICFDEFHEGDREVIFSCGHVFHMKCVGEWAKKYKTCPNCRSELKMKRKKSNIYFDKHVVNMKLIEKLSSKSLKCLLEEYKIDHSVCIEKSDLLNKVNNDIFFKNKNLGFVKKYLKSHRVNTERYVEKSNLLNMVAFIRLMERF